MQMLMKTDGIAAVAQGAITGGLVYFIVALVVKFAGNAWIDKILPPVVVGTNHYGYWTSLWPAQQ